MEKKDIKALSGKINTSENIEKIKNSLKNNYEISFGEYSALELKKALYENKPILIENNFIIGYEPKQGFVNSDEKFIKIEDMTKALIFEDVIPEKTENIRENADPFVIINKMQWETGIDEFRSIIGSLKIGEIFLPPHSAIFNFLNPTPEQKKKKIVSMLEGASITIFDPDNYIDNVIHEIGHLFWRDCLNIQEKKLFEYLFKNLKPSAIYEYEWERETAEEVFCTIYKWYVKSILINRAFYNILEFEEEKGLQLLQGVLYRLSQERQREDTWQLSQKDLYNYINPMLNISTGQLMRKAGLLEKIQAIEIPEKILNDLERYESGKRYIKLEKAIIPVKGNRIDFDELEKARMTKYIRRISKPGGGWKYIYKEDVKQESKSNKIISENNKKINTKWKEDILKYLNKSDEEKSAELLSLNSWFIEKLLESVKGKISDKIFNSLKKVNIHSENDTKKINEILKDAKTNDMEEISHVVQKNINEIINEENLEDVPSWYFMSSPKIVNNKILIHFTDNSNEIEKNGFIGIKSIKDLGWSRNLGKEKREKGGFGFAFNFSGGEKIINQYMNSTYGYGEEAIIFISDGVEVKHEKDDESEIIFKGGDVKKFLKLKSGENKNFALYEKDNILIESDDYKDIEKFIDKIQNKPLKKAFLSYNEIEYYAKKQNNKPIVYLDMDGVVADFSGQYRKLFGDDPLKLDAFTVKQAVSTVPDFFRYLPVIAKGRELFDILRDDYTIVFLTTPMEGVHLCKVHKLEWILDNFGPEYDVLFSSNKAEYVIDEKSILIDDMGYNLKPWAEAGGTAINSNNSIDDICDKIEEAITGKRQIKTITEKLKLMVVEKNPTENQKETGNYKKGKIVFKGIPVTIENIPGSTRFGFGLYGKKWLSRMKAYYGYINKVEGNDGDEIDCYIGPKLNASKVFVINQNNSGGIFDEHKVVFGCETMDEARALYLAHYEKGWDKNIHSISQTNTKKLRDWLRNRTKSEPYQG